MLPAVINFKLKLLLPMVRSSDGQEEGETHSLGLCYHLGFSLRNGQAQMYGITMREGRKKQPKTVRMFLNDHRLINS